MDPRSDYVSNFDGGQVRTGMARYIYIPVHYIKWCSNISKQVTLAASQGGHVAPNSPGRPISHSAAQIARSGFSMAVDFGRQERRPRRPESSRPLDLALDVSDLL